MATLGARRDEDGARFGLGLALLASLLSLLAVAGCRDRDGDPERDEPNDPGMMIASGPGPDTSTGQVDEPSREASDQCELAPIIGAGTHYGSLRGTGSELGGACGQGGPDAFFRLDVPRRSDVQLRGLGAGFSPRVGVLPNDCVAQWETRTLLCSQGVGTWALDVAGGSSLVVSVGIDAEDPALGQPPPMLGADPLSFALEVRLRNVLDEGDPCEPADRGRCGSGTTCMPSPPPPDDPQGPPGPAVCTALDGDTCDSAVDVALGAGSSLVQIDPAAPQTDAHEHSCGGARRRERVLRLSLPGTGPHALRVRSDWAPLGLALRGPGCLPADELGCAIDDVQAPELLAEIPADVALLFVELPPAEEEDLEGTSTGTAPGEESPIELEIEVLEAPPPR
ncbi:MAG: hypothetical protein AB1Z98_23665 [Nannocystaceae bacterium]